MFEVTENRCINCKYHSVILLTSGRKLIFCNKQNVSFSIQKVGCPKFRRKNND